MVFEVGDFLDSHSFAFWNPVFLKMRKKLKNFDWHVHKLSIRDLDITFKLTKNLINAKIKELESEEERIRKDEPELAYDILDDIFYYAWVDMQILWQFCLWRLQAVFEGIITTVLLSEEEAEGLVGLKSKLKKLRSSGYKIKQEKYDELIEWGDLRNALSHCPPEHYRPISLEESDVKEYLTLLKLVVEDLKKQKAKIKG